jgi:mannose-1-phosphate guanylyltransferase
MSPMNQHIFVVLMAGGSGTRFWPLSRRARPKQVLSIVNDRPMIRETVDRLGPLAEPSRVLVVTGADQAESIRAALPEIPPRNVLCEPAPRNTAPCLGLAASVARGMDPDAVLLCLPADHVIWPVSDFRDAARRALERAFDGRTLITFGVRPTRPATGYGYIREGEETAPGIRKIAEFVEKPKRKTAEEYFASGQYRWNSGMFAWRADVFLEEAAAHLPELSEGLDRVRSDAGCLDEVFPTLPSISVDYGIMERTARAEVIAADFDWDDVGSFGAMERLMDPDEDGNRARGDLLAIGANNLTAVAPEGHLVAAIGVKDLVVVVTDDATLVCQRKDAERVKEMVEELKRRGRTELL